jgi:hypothetical protein
LEFNGGLGALPAKAFERFGGFVNSAKGSKGSKGFELFEDFAKGSQLRPRTGFLLISNMKEYIKNIFRMFLIYIYSMVVHLFSRIL